MCTKLCQNVYKNVPECVQKCARKCTKLCWNVYKNVLECVQNCARMCTKTVPEKYTYTPSASCKARECCGIHQRFGSPKCQPRRLTCGKNFHTICFSSPAIWLPPVRRNRLCSYVGVCSAVGYLYSLRQRSVGQMTVLRLSGATRQQYCCHEQKYNSLHQTGTRHTGSTDCCHEQKYNSLHQTGTRHTGSTDCCHEQKYNSLHHAMTFIFMFRPQRYKKCIFANLCSENLHVGAFFRRGDLQMSEIFCTFVRHFVQKPRIIPCVEKILRS